MVNSKKKKKWFQKRVEGRDKRIYNITCTRVQGAGANIDQWVSMRASGPISFCYREASGQRAQASCCPRQIHSHLYSLSVKEQKKLKTNT